MKNMSSNQQQSLDAVEMEIFNRAKSFYNPSNNWRFENRSDFQTPFAFAEAGLVCCGRDVVTCLQCNTTFRDWKLSDVPLTEHKKIVNCPFVKTVRSSNLKNHPLIRYALDNELDSFDNLCAVVKEIPHLLDLSMEDFLCTLIKRKKSGQLNKDCQWDEMMRKYCLR